MTQLKHSYYFVRGHLDNDYFEDGLKIIKYQNYTPEYRNETIGRLKQLR